MLLRAGVDFPDDKLQVEMAMKAGASGVLGGRAFWKEYFLQEGQAAREKFAREEAVSRVKQVDGIVKEQGRPWYAWYGMKLDQLATTRVTEGWHFRYSGPAAGGARGAIVEGEVY